MTKIYLAGKITQNDWRGAFFEHPWDLRDARPDECDPLYTKVGHEYTGPFFISCDHGCYHGNSTHALTGPGCQSENGYHRNDILMKCLNWINRADIVFAWIDSTDCYGTLAEIGYAYTHNKHIWIAFSDKLFNYKLGTQPDLPENHDMWFVSQMADDERLDVINKPYQIYEIWSFQHKLLSEDCDIHG